MLSIGCILILEIGCVWAGLCFVYIVLYAFKFFLYKLTCNHGMILKSAQTQIRTGLYSLYSHAVRVSTLHCRCKVETLGKAAQGWRGSCKYLTNKTPEKY